MERRYIIHSQAWWAPANPLPAGVVEEVGFSIHDDDDVLLGEARATWHDLGRGEVSPRLEAFDDAWLMLDLLTTEGLTEQLAELDSEAPTPERFCELLRAFGFEDATPRKGPLTVAAGQATSVFDDSPEANALRAKRVRPLLDAYRAGPLAGDPDDETVATDLVVDVLHAVGEPEQAAEVVRRAWGHYAAETGAEGDPPAFASLVAAVGAYRDWLAEVTDEAGDPKIPLAEFDADRSDAWREVVEAALAVVEEAER